MQISISWITVIIATKITIFRLRLHRKFSFYCIQSMFSSVICCSQCQFVSDLQSFFVIVCLETWQNARGNGSYDTGCLFMSFQLLYAYLHVLIVLMIMIEKTNDCFFLAS